MIKVENSRIKSVQHYLQKAKEFVLDNPINQLEHISFSIKKDKFVKINEVFDDVYKNGAGYYIIDIFFKNEEDASYEDDDVYEYDKNSYIVVKPGIQDFQSYEEDFLNVITYNIQELNNIFMNTNLNCESKVYTVLESINAVSNRVIDIESIPSWVIIYFINSAKDTVFFTEYFVDEDYEGDFVNFLDLTYHTKLYPEIKELLEDFKSK